jgi:hypothetical protein
MDKFEKEYMRQMMTDVIDIHAANVRGEFAVVNLKLEEIGKLAVRVTDLETKPHPVETCPYSTDIKDLRDNMISAKTERKFIGKVAGVAVAAITVLLTILKLFIIN